jgi:hypothetical protein
MRSLWVFVLVCLSTLTLAGCELAGDIFQAGMWVGVIGIVLVVAIVAFLASKLRS